MTFGKKKLKPISICIYCEVLKVDALSSALVMHNTGREW